MHNEKTVLFNTLLTYSAQSLRDLCYYADLRTIGNRSELAMRLVNSGFKF